MSGYYGVLHSSFWTGPTGQQIRELAGKDGQILALYLISNEHTNMIGLYRLPVSYIREEAGLGNKAIERGLAATAHSDFAHYDARSAFVFVRQMARVRLGLKEGDGLEREDKRVIAVNRIYQAVQGNPFLGAFFDAYARPLQIKKRRESVGLVVPFTCDPNPSPLGRGIEGASKGHRSQRSDQDQVQDQSTPPTRARETDAERLPIIGLVPPRPRVNPSLPSGGYVAAGTLPRDHLRCAFCWRKCVPDFLHGEFLTSVGGDPDSRDDRLRAFYRRVADEVGEDQAIGEDKVQFWKGQFRAKFSSPKHGDPTKPNAAAGRTGSHNAAAYDRLTRRDGDAPRRQSGG